MFLAISCKMLYCSKFVGGDGVFQLLIILQLEDFYEDQRL